MGLAQKHRLPEDMARVLLQALCIWQSLHLGLSQATPLCSWLDSKGWTGGAKVRLKINVVEETSSWNISFDFNKDVTFEAWKGDINALTGSIYHVTNKCYNGRLYPCQCLEFGYLIRFSGAYPTANISFNGVAAPACPSEPTCNGVATTTPQPTTTTTTTSTTTTAEAPHPCESDPCHQDALCLVVGAGYNCTCVPSFVETGVDLFNSSSTETACALPSGGFNFSANVANQNDTINNVFGTVFDDTAAFDGLTTLMDGLGVTENTTDAEYITLLFSNQAAIDLLIQAVGSNAIAIQAVNDAIGSDLNSQIIFLAALGNANTGTTLSPSGLKRHRSKRQFDRGISAQEAKVYARIFVKNVNNMRRTLRKTGLCSKYQELLSLLDSLNCEETLERVQEIQQILEENNFLNLLQITYYLHEILNNNISPLLQSGQLFRYLRKLRRWQKVQECIAYAYLSTEIGDAKLCDGDFCCHSTATCTSNGGDVRCSCNEGLQYYAGSSEGCVEAPTTLPEQTTDVSGTPDITDNTDDADTTPGMPNTEVPIVTENTDGSDTMGPMTGQPHTDGPMSGEPTTDGPISGEPQTSGPMSEEPMTGQPMTGEPMTEEPYTDGQTTGEMQTDGPATEEPFTDGQGSEEPVPTQVSVEAPILIYSSTHGVPSLEPETPLNLPPGESSSHFEESSTSPQVMGSGEAPIPMSPSAHSSMAPTNMYPTTPEHMGSGESPVPLPPSADSSGEMPIIIPSDSHSSSPEPL